MKNGDFFDRSDFVISYELLKLLEWLMKNDQKGLRQLISKAVENGILKNENGQDVKDPEKVQQVIVEFLVLVDSILQESVKEDETEEILQRALIPAVNNIDLNLHDSNSVANSLARATKTERSIEYLGQSPKDIFCKELLKNWRPDKKQTTVH